MSGLEIQPSRECDREPDRAPTGWEVTLVIAAHLLGFGLGYWFGTAETRHAAEVAVAAAKPARSPLVGTAQLLAGTRGPVFYGSLFGAREKGCVVVDLSAEGWWYCPDRDCDGWSDELDPDAVNGWECKPLPCGDGHCDDLRVFEFTATAR